MLPSSYSVRRDPMTSLSDSSHLRGNNAEVHRRTQSSMLNSLITGVRVPHFTPTTCQLLPSPKTPQLPPKGILTA